MLIAWFGFVVAGLVLLGTRAFANGYLVVLSWRRGGPHLLERGADGLYHLFAGYLLPFVLVRYLVWSVAYSLLLLHRRVHVLTRSTKPVAVTAKV